MRMRIIVRALVTIIITIIVNGYDQESIINENGEEFKSRTICSSLAANEFTLFQAFCEGWCFASHILPFLFRLTVAVV